MRDKVATFRLAIHVLALLCLFGLSFVPAAADELSESLERLTRLQQRIDSTLKDLQKKQARAEDLNNDLADLQTEIGRVAGQVKRSDRQLAELDGRLEQQEQTLVELEAKQRQTSVQLKKRLTTLYKTGDAGLIKILFASTETPQALAEKYEFLSRMVRHDRQLIEDYRQQQLAEQQILSDLKALREKQGRLVERRRREQRALESAQKSRRQLLAAVRKDEQALTKMLDQLRAKAARLNDLVKKLETEQTQTYTEKLPGLASMKGQLPWPVPGPVRVGFGPNRHAELGTMIESHGLEIEAPSGSQVSSVAAGKVIYASNLRGYGKLLIIDHGSKDYSLYAQVARFLKKVGEPVSAGEQIAYSGYEGKDFVYFEIRHGGQPLDPLDWLKPR